MNSSSKDPFRYFLGGYLAGLIEGDGSIIVPKTIEIKLVSRTVLIGWAYIFYEKATGPFVKKYSTNSKNSITLHPQWVTGFSDGEACFSIDISKVKDHTLGWKVTPVFSIGIHSKDLVLLQKIQSFFNGAGKIYFINDYMIYYRIKSIKDLIKYVIPHFDKYPLLTKKRADFLLFKQIIDLMTCKKHLTIEGLLEIVSIKASLNLGLNENLKNAFPNVIPKVRPIFEVKAIQDPHWIVGFADAESCFFVEKSVSSTNKLGYQVRLKFIISQHSRDVALVNLLKDYLNCGNVITDSRGLSHLIIRKYSDIISCIIPFFAKYPLHSVKSMDYLDLCKASKIIDNKAHLTEEGLKQIDLIRSGMNRGRFPPIN